ncbi:unnamed protein product [Mytilus edulis]|uniref:Uncharacterized protein n=1 Tax=Mytilus edulis TaxID=6550 RepID=A0A8S3QMF3_MYTED|nr:unnamed protein product [Mytilus edulis]
MGLDPIFAWKDQFLHWNKSQYNNLTEILVSRNDVWTPDLLVENTAFGYRELGIDGMYINLDYTGLMIWEPGVVMQTICEVDIAKYPFDHQFCGIRVMSWMHTNRSLNVVVEKNTVDVTNYYPNGEWDLASTSVSAFSPDDGSYNHGEILPGAEAVLRLRRRPVYYIISTILPISMLSLLNVLVFLLPTSTGEKMTLAVTVLLSFTVFMSVVNEVMPKTSNSVSILAVYLTMLLSLSGLSVASTVLVLYFHHRNKSRGNRYPDRTNEIHTSRLYRINRPENNNRNKSLSKNGMKPSTERLLDDYMDIADSSENFSVEEKDSCCKSIRKKFKRRTHSCQCHTSSSTFADRLDRAMFIVVTILTVLSTAVAMILLVYW